MLYYVSGAPACLIINRINILWIGSWERDPSAVRVFFPLPTWLFWIILYYFVLSYIILYYFILLSVESIFNFSGFNFAIFKIIVNSVNLLHSTVNVIVPVI